MRVVMADGSPVTFTPVLVRNLLRFIDFLPVTYALGVVLVFATKKNQRLGDLAAGTVVVRERKIEHNKARTILDRVDVPPGFDATAVTQQQLALARSFDERKATLSWEARQRIAKQIAADLRLVVMDPTGKMSAVELISAVVAAKTGLGRSQ